MSFFITLDQQGIARKIDEARRRVILAAPGIWRPVADALNRAADRLGKDNVVVVVDASANVARLGLGEFDSIAKLRSAGIDVRQHAGFRLGVLVCDNQGVSFAMAAALVEEDPTADTDAFNAIHLTEVQVEQLVAELPPTARRSEEAAPATEPVVGSEPVDPNQLVKVAIELKDAPPQNFDLSRQTNVYSPWVQFVELEMPGFKPRSRKVKLPESLELLHVGDGEMHARITSSLRLLSDFNGAMPHDEIKRGVESLRDRFLIPVGMGDRVILKRDLPEFQKRLDEYIFELRLCHDQILQDLENALVHLVGSVSRELAPLVLQHMPMKLRREKPYATLEDAQDFVAYELRKALPDPWSWVRGIQIRVRYKDLTYSTIKDEEFIRRLAARLPEDMRHLPLADEYRAAKARTSDAKRVA